MAPFVPRRAGLGLPDAAGCDADDRAEDEVDEDVVPPPFTATVVMFAGSGTRGLWSDV